MDEDVIPKFGSCGVEVTIRTCWRPGDLRKGRSLRIVTIDQIIEALETLGMVVEFERTRDEDIQMTRVVVCPPRP